MTITHTSRAGDAGASPFPEGAPRFLDIHVLHSSPFANLNRDDLGLPKEVQYGGVRRARVSSQCQKRAVRLAMQERQDIESAVRTRRLPLDVAELMDGIELTTDTPAMTDTEGAGNRESEKAKWTTDLAKITASALLASVGIKPYKDTPTTDILTFLPQGAAADIANIIREHEDALIGVAREQEKKLSHSDDKKDKDKKFGAVVEKFGTLIAKHSDADKSLQKLIEEEDSKAIHASMKQVIMSDNPMIALFGRMLTAMPASNVDGAAQVAHAFTTHEAHIDSDYFTTVDDSNRDEDPGAGFLDVGSYTSGTFYKYATVDLRDLWSNMDEGTDPHLVARIAAAFAAAFTEEISSAKKTVTAPHSPTMAVLVVARSRRPVSYAYAFECPVEAAGGFIAPSIERLLAANAEQVSASGPEQSWVYVNGVVHPEAGEELTPLSDIERSVGQFLGRRLA